MISAASAELLPGTLDLRHLFDGDKRLLFLDIVHSSEVGAAVVAARILDAIDAKRASHVPTPLHRRR